LYGVFLFLLTCASAHAGQQLVVGVEDKDWPGHYRWAEGTLEGIDADLVRAVAEKFGYEVAFRPFPWPRVISMAEDKAIDAVLDLAPTEQRNEFLYFVSTPVSVESTVFWVKKGSSFHYTGKFDRSMRIGLMHGSDWSGRFAREGTPTIKVFHTYKAAFNSLVEGRIDAFGGYLTPTREHVHRLGFEDLIEPSLPIIWELPYYFAFTRKKGYEELAKRFSEVLAVFFYSPAYDELLERHGGADMRKFRSFPEVIDQ